MSLLVGKPAYDSLSYYYRYFILLRTSTIPIKRNWTLIFLYKYLLFSFPSILFSIKPGFPLKTRFDYKRNFMRQHQTLANCYWASFCYQENLVKGEGTQCKNLQKSWKCSKTFGGIVAATVVNNFPLTFVMLLGYRREFLFLHVSLLVISA